MKKLTYILFASTALFVNSSAFGLEAKLPSTSITQALQDAKNRNNYATLKSAKFEFILLTIQPTGLFINIPLYALPLQLITSHSEFEC